MIDPAAAAHLEVAEKLIGVAGLDAMLIEKVSVECCGGFVKTTSHNGGKQARCNRCIPYLGSSSVGLARSRALPLLAPSLVSFTRPAHVSRCHPGALSGTRWCSRPALETNITLL